MSIPIAYIASQFPLRSETFVWREVRELRRRGWTVHTFGLRAPTEETPESLRDLRDTTVDVYDDRSRMPLSASNLARAAKVGFQVLRDTLAPGERMTPRGRTTLVAQANAGARLAWRLQSLGVRHVHAHFAHAPASVAMYAASAAGIPFSFTGHANDLFQRRQALALKLRRAKFVSCISEWHRGFYRSIVDRPDGDYPIVRCGVDVDSFVPVPNTTRADRPRVLTVCRLVEKKGVDLLIRAVARLRDESTHADLTIAGDGPQRTMLEALVDELSVRDRVTFLGAVDADRVRGLFSQSDLFVLPCRVDANGDKDGIPVVLMEAMASGVPVVSGDLPAIRELVIDDETGLLVQAEAIPALAGAMKRLFADVGLAQRLGRNARSRVVDEFALTVNAARLETLFIGQSPHQT